MTEINSLTLNGKKYDSFPDQTARESITKNVKFSDVINNLTTEASDKPLSAAQGVALKALIDAITVPTKVSQLQNDAGYAKTSAIPTKPSDIGAQPVGNYLGEAQLTEAINTALAKAKESGAFDGKDGTSVNHYWSGTTLNVSSASGTSSANLKGEKGDKGEPGTFTDADREAIVQQVITAIGTPVFGRVDSEGKITLSEDLLWPLS